MSKPKKDREEKLAVIEQLFRSEYEGMADFAAYLLGSESLAEVAVQETFVCAMEHIDKLLASPNRVGWLYNALKLTIRHIKREQYLLLKRTMQLEDVPEQHLSTADRYSLALHGEEADPELQLLIRFYLYGYTLKELAEEMGLTVGAVKMRISRAKAHVKRKYHLFSFLPLLFPCLLACIR